MLCLMLLAAMSDNSGGMGGVANVASGGKVKKPRKRYDILKTASCSVCGEYIFLSISFLVADTL